MNMNITKWDNAKQAIAECRSIDEIKEIRDRAEALRQYAKQAKESLQVQNDIAEIKLRAERRAGEMLKEANIPKHNEKNELQDVTRLKDIGIEKHESSRWQKEADIPEEVFEQHIAEVKNNNIELTQAGLLKLHNELEREKIKIKNTELQGKLEKLPNKKYQTIVIDPPWPIQKIMREVRPNQVSEIDYPTMSIDEIKKFPINELVHENCHIYLWTTHKFLPVAFEVFQSWGVRYECLLTWVKNVGFTPFSFMYSTEHVLFGRIGSLELLKKGKRLDFDGKVRQHSRKPDEFYNLVREVSPSPRIDIFSRQEHEGFDQYGNEKAKFQDRCAA